MKMKRGLISLLALTLLASPTMVFGQESSLASAVSVRADEVMPIDTKQPLMPIKENSYYDTVRGTVLGIKETENGKILSLGNDGSVHTHLSVTNDTYVVADKELKVGDVVTGYFEGGMMHIMIYPARYTAEVLVVESKDSSAYVGVLDNELLTEDGSMYIQVGEKTEVKTVDNKVYTEDLAYKRVVAVYGVVRESYPAQATADKIIVLGDQSKIQPEIKYSLYSEVKGKIVNIEKREGRTYLNIEEVSGNPSVFVLSESTYVLDNEVLKIGDSVVGYYKSDSPMLMIYPPQYSLDALVKESGIDSIYVGSFDKENLSDNGNLVLGNIDNIPVVSSMGKKYSSSITNKPVLVVYNVATKSIPAQIKPLKIVVLEKEVESMDIVVVNGSLLKGIRGYKKDEVTMLPLRAISEALGYEVGWDNSTKTVLIGKAISLSIGKDAYNFAKMVPIKLGTSPELKNGSTYVPLEFFTEVVKVNEVNIDNVININ